MKPFLVNEYPCSQTHSKKLAMLAGVDRLEDVFVVANLLEQDYGIKGSIFCMETAREQAEQLISNENSKRRWVFVGRRAAKAFGFRPRVPYFIWLGRYKTASVIPHPSAVVGWWNDQTNVKNAQEFLSKLARSQS